MVSVRSTLWLLAAGLALVLITTPADAQADCEADLEFCDFFIGAISVFDDASCASHEQFSCGSIGAGATTVAGDADCRGGEDSCGNIGTGATTVTGDAECYGRDRSCGYAGAGATSVTGDATCSGTYDTCGSLGLGATSVTGDATCYAGDNSCGVGPGIGAFSVTGDAHCPDTGAESATCGSTSGGVGAVSVLGHAYCDEEYSFTIHDAGTWTGFKCIGGGNVIDQATEAVPCPIGHDCLAPRPSQACDRAPLGRPYCQGARDFVRELR